MSWQNTVDGYCQGKEKLCDKIVDFVNKNTAWVQKKIKSDPKKPGSNPYWHQLSLIYDQLQGLEAGYDAKIKLSGGPRIPHGDIFWMNIFGDLEDLEQVFDQKEEFNKTRIFGSGSCSALIKLLPNNEDLYMAHDTWNTYQSMIRMLKKYNLSYHWTTGPQGSQSVVPGSVLIFFEKRGCRLKT
jgi:hypothetical protein